jgi:mannose-6-phosphate isomerase-like protein (cupin superfamily)
MSETNNHQTVIVRKPWGYEYLAYKNENVALWVLHIAHNESTSMHCHPTKTTGLVVVDGQAKIDFIADSKLLDAPAKQMIRRGLFHQTQALSDNGIIMFEFETPVDKDDLVRLKDNYGRKDSGYEGTQYELPRTEDCLWIDDTKETTYVIGSSVVKIIPVSKLADLNKLDDNDIIAFIRGGLIKIVDRREHLVTVPGDVGLVKVVKQVAKEMDAFARDSVLMLIQKKQGDI